MSPYGATAYYRQDEYAYFTEEVKLEIPPILEISKGWSEPNQVIQLSKVGVAHSANRWTPLTSSQYLK